MAGESAVAAAAPVELPFHETGYFPADTPSAVAYRFPLQRGRRLVVDVTFQSSAPARLFVELFESRDPEGPRLVAALAPDATTLRFDVDRDGVFLLRLQPELLRAGRFTAVQRTESSLVFPVSGMTARAVQSGFGAARDAGIREHEGIDIFAARGVPVVAVADGVAQPGTNNLGGNVVWLRDRASGLTYYYAHLDRWAIEGSAAIRAGEVLGYVGNTGNARSTSPHLHFGIYDRGAIDPLPFVQPDDPVPEPGNGSVERLGALVRTASARTPLRTGAGRTATVRADLPPGTLARIAGAARASYRVTLPDGSTGYVAVNAVGSADAAMRRRRLGAGIVIRDRPAMGAATIVDVRQPATADVLGVFGEFEFVRVPDGVSGWVQSAAAGA